MSKCALAAVRHHSLSDPRRGLHPRGRLRPAAREALLPLLLLPADGSHRGGRRGAAGLAAPATSAQVSRGGPHGTPPPRSLAISANQRPRSLCILHIDLCCFALRSFRVTSLATVRTPSKFFVLHVDAPRSMQEATVQGSGMKLPPFFHLSLL